MSARDVGDGPLVLTLDIGTSSVRAMLFDRFARAVPGLAARVDTDVRTTVDGGVEVEPDVLLAGIMSCVDELLERAGSATRRIIAVGSASLVGNVLGVAEDGAVLTPLYTWADTRSTAVAAELRQELDETAVHDRTGCLLRSSYLPAQFRWLRKTDPDTMRRVKHWISIGEYLHLRLFGSTAASYSVASWSGLLDRRALRWDPELVSVAGIDLEQLSALVDRDQAQHGLRREYARRWPSLADVPWFPTIGDGAASSAGCGCVTPERMALALGTSGAVRVMTEGEIEHIPTGLWVYRVDRRRSLLGGALSEGGNLFAWLKATLDLTKDRHALEEELATLAPDGHGLTVLPFVAGERSPGWHGDARATIAGLSLHTRPVDIVRAGLEAIGYRFALLTSLAREAVPGVVEVVGSGGPLQASIAWAHIICDILGQPLLLSAENEATSRGVALLSLEALGVIERLDRLPAEIDRTCLPALEHQTAYGAGAARHHRLYQLLLGDATG
jgi:gluconokinase